jgi:hypothetical protein
LRLEPEFRNNYDKLHLDFLNLGIGRVGIVTKKSCDFCIFLIFRYRWSGTYNKKSNDIKTARIVNKITLNRNGPLLIFLFAEHLLEPLNKSN